MKQETVFYIAMWLFGFLSGCTLCVGVAEIRRLLNRDKGAQESDTTELQSRHER